MATDLPVFNGINGASGGYWQEPLTFEAIARVARGQPLDPAELRDVQLRRAMDAGRQDHFGIREGLDPDDLSQAGWGVIFSADLEGEELQKLTEALAPLLELRRSQASQVNELYYREFSGKDGYRPGESKGDFLKRFGRGAGPADPQKVPYYLLIVGDPEDIPYAFQYQLDVQYAVGRIFFENPEDYHRYACSVVTAETHQAALPRRITFFSPENEDDRATELSTSSLIGPLVDFVQQDQPGWQVQWLAKDQAYKTRLSELFRSPESPALLFTASHGMAFPHGEPRQLTHQGALLCQDWPGPRRHRGPIPENFYFSAEDLEGDARVSGSIAFFFACYGAGTPKNDNFYRLAFRDPSPLAPKSFLARLPQKLLSHPGGGALAVIGHVDRAWGYSFSWSGGGQDVVMFESTLKSLLEGSPVGSAMEYFNQRYAELSTDLTSELDETTPEMQNELKIASLWTCNNDARNYAVIGDPAVRLRTA